VKRLYILRHAKSSWSDPALADFDRPLSDRGRQACAAMGDYMAAELPAPELVLCSPARRTRETWELVAARAGWTPAALYEEGLYAAAAASLWRRLRAVESPVARAMLVGHNPALQELALHMAGRGLADVLERLERKLPTGALVEIGFELAGWDELAPGAGRLERFVRPRDLSALPRSRGAS